MTFPHTESRLDDPVSLVVPLFNEQDRLLENGHLFASWIEEKPPGSHLVLVDDGSRDSTNDIAHALTASSDRIYHFPRPHLGKGAAVAFGLTQGTNPIAGYTDVDLSTPLDEVDRLCSIAADSGALTIGSRGMPETQIGTHQARPREALGRLFNLWVQATIAPGIRDTQCGAKFAKRELWQFILPRAEEAGFAWDAEVIAVALRTGYEVVEVGIEWSHDPNTRVHMWRDGIAMAAAVFRVSRRLGSYEKVPEAHQV